MNNFEYANPASLKEALALLGNSYGDAAVLAGGTDLLSMMKEYLVQPKRLVNVKNLKELQGISKTACGLRIGAAATIEDVLENAAVRAEYPSLTAAARGISSPQIRNMGTVGGDLAQRPRCWYFRNGFGLFGAKDGKSLVTDGENKYHAIFSSGPAKFVSASSLGPALIALGFFHSPLMVPVYISPRSEKLRPSTAIDSDFLAKRILFVLSRGVRI